MAVLTCCGGIIIRVGRALGGTNGAIDDDDGATAVDARLSVLAPHTLSLPSLGAAGFLVVVQTLNRPHQH
jgi:hypothetical protein